MGVFVNWNKWHQRLIQAIILAMAILGAVRLLKEEIELILR
jgi:hypothetical protein